MKIKLQYLENYNRSWGELSKAHSSDAGIDLRAAIREPYTLMPKDMMKIPLGICTQFEEGYEAQLRARSGLAARFGIGLVNGIGTIDAGYRGEWAVVLYNHGQIPYTINPGGRVCQVVFNKLPDIDIVEGVVTDDDDRCGGFGSSGVN